MLASTIDTTATSLKKTAHIAGALFFATAVATIFGVLFVRSELIVFNDATVTANNILSHEFLFRSGIAVNLVCQVIHVFLGLTLYRLFQGVNKSLSLIFLTSKLISATIAVVSTLGSLGALMMLENKANFLGAFQPEQLKALMMLCLKLGNEMQGLLEIFWLPTNFALGLLFLQSRFVPKILGILLIIASFGFPINVFSHLLLPNMQGGIMFQITVAMGAIGGLPTIFWLLIMGVKVPPPVDGQNALGTA